MRYRLQETRNLVGKATKIVVIGLMGGMAGVVIVQTLSRYLFKIPIFWGEELARYLMIWVCFTGAAIATHEKSHVSVEYVVTRFPKKICKGIMITTKLLVMLFLFYLIREGIIIAPRIWRQVSPTMRIQMTWPYLAIPVGSALMLFEMVFILLDDFKKVN